MNRAAVQAAALPQGVKHEAYGEMLQTLRAGIVNAQSDEAAAEALAATLLEQYPAENIRLDIQKPGALEATREVGLRIYRARK